MIAADLQPLARPIDSLTALDGNPRRGDVEAVARSYARFGQRKPIVARRDGTVIAGNHQLQAALSLGWTEIAVVYVDDDDQTATAFALADNRTSDLGTYDEEALAALLADVALDTDLLLATGYNAHDLADLEALLEETAVDYDPPAPTRSGVDPDTGFALAPGPSERLDQYYLSTVRSVVLDFDLETFEYVTSALAKLRAEYDVTSNAAVVEHLLRQVCP